MISCKSRYTVNDMPFVPTPLKTGQYCNIVYNYKTHDRSVQITGA